VIHLSSQDPHEQNPKEKAKSGSEKLGLGDKRVFMMDAVGGIYTLKKSLKADIGSFEKEFMSRAGRQSAKDFFSSSKADYKDDDPKKAMEKMLGVFSQLGLGDFSVTNLDRESRLVRISSTNTVEGWAYHFNNDTQLDCVCAYASGVLAEVWRQAFSPSGHEDVEVHCVETDCLAQGKTECRFVVGPTKALLRAVPGFDAQRESPSEHVLRLNEEILMKNLELQSINLGLERQARKKFEELDRASENYRNLINLSPDPVIVGSVEGSLEMANDHALRLIGFNLIEEAKGLPLWEILGGKKEKWESIVWKLDKEGLVKGLDVKIVSKDGTEAEGELHARFADLQAGKHVVMIFRDDSERKLMELQMAEAKSESDFLNDLLAHDITNYAMSALHFLGSLQQSQTFSAEDRRKLGIITRDIQGAFELSTSVRDLSHIKAMAEDQMEIRDLQLVISEATEEAERMYSDRRIKINFSRLSEPTFVRGSQFLTRLFSNLLTNSIKFDPGDEVVIDLTVESVVENNMGYWCVKVTDRGVGIPNSEKERVFEKFHRLDQSVPGTGLGLYVARFIANAYGGSISAESRVPEDHTKGTRMIVMLQKARERDVAELSMRGLTRKRF